MASGNGSAALAKRPDETPVARGELRTPSHGGGKLRNGALPGQNRAGPGRTASAVRKALLLAGAKRIPVLQQIADNVEAAPAERIRAVNVMLTHGLDDKALTLGSVQERIMLTADLLRSTLPPELYESIAPRLRAIWNAT